MMILETHDLKKYYGAGDTQVKALDGVDLSIEQGEFVAIIGTSGSGKSTMMNILGCLDVPTRGEYLLDGTPIRERTQRELSQIRSRQIAFIFQGYNLIPSLNVWQNVALPMLYQRVPLAERRARAMEALEKVEIAAKADNRPAQLSGSSGWPSPGPSPPARPSSWPTSPPGRWTPEPASRCWASCAR